MAEFTITPAGVEILDGTQTVNTFVSVGSTPIRMGTGVVGVRPVADLAPIAGNTIYIVPPLVRTTLYVTGAINGTVWTEGYGV